MECEQSKMFFAGSLDGEQSPAEKKALEQHLEECADCRKEFDSMRLLWDQINVVDDSVQFPEMRKDFRMMLNAFQVAEKKTRWADIYYRMAALWNSQPKFQLAYSVLIIIGCLLYMNWLIRSVTARDSQLTRLSAQVQELKQGIMLVLLESPSASERIRAVSYADETGKTNQHVIEALFATLNNDPDVNVRLTTLDALTKFAGQPEVREQLVGAITSQDSPIMQYAIADLMLRLQEKKSVRSFRELLKQDNLEPGVREKITETVSKLI